MDKKVILFLIEKRGKNRNRFYEMFTNDNEILLKKIKNAVGRSTYHEYIKDEISKINQTLNEINEKVKVFENSFIEKNGKELKAIKKNPQIQIIQTTYHYILRMEIDDKDGKQNG